MLKIEQIIEAMSPAVQQRGLFMVEVKVSKDNDVTLVVESSDAVVTLDDCEALNRTFTGIFDQEAEDYSLTVSSAGLDACFKVPEQYRKAVGSKVEIWLRGGRKLVSMLRGSDGGTVVTDDGSFDMKEINKVKYHIEF